MGPAGDGEALAPAERVLGTAVPRRRQLHPPVGGPVRDRVGVDRIMWGSDYPHKESSFPFSHEAIQLSFQGVPHDEVAAMLGANAARVYGFDLDALRPLAQEFGPRVVHRRRAVDRGRRAGRGAEVPGIRRDRTRRRLTSRVSRRTRRG